VITGTQNQETGGLNERYSYDAFGNLQQSGNFNFIHEYTTANRLSGYSYDAAGNLLEDGLGNTYTWDANEMISSSNGTSYYYDAEGDRVGKSGSTPTDTIYFGGRPVARLAGGAWTDLIYGAGSLLAEVPGTQTGAPVYRMTDPLGSSVGTLSSTGALTGGIQDYAPFGELFNGSSTTDPYKFTGKERDTESGNDYFEARYFGSSMGRFMSPDPLLNSGHPDNPQTWNRYAYAGNNPLRYIDPTGLFFFTNSCDHGDADCNTAYEQMKKNVRDMVAATRLALQRALDIGDTTQVAALQRTLSGLGAEDKLNARGQTVNISVNLRLDTPGQTSFAEGSTSTINIVLNPGTSTDSNDVYGAQAAAAHEGVHAGEIMPGTPTWSQEYSTEHDAYETESYFAQYIGYTDIHSPQMSSDMVGGVLDMSKDFVIWNPSWAKLDAATISSRRSAGVDAAARDGADADCASFRGGCKK
jgi:RHS repeat-associated protein